MSQPSARWRNVQALAWSAVAALPFLLFPVIHAVRCGDEATGLATYDLPYYAANARAILDRGRLGFYPNPFDPDPDAPVIYSHWLMLGLAGLMGPVGLSPGLALFAIQCAGALASARVMLAMIDELFPENSSRLLLFFSTMWSGGLLVLGGLVRSIASGAAWNRDVLAFDPGQGLWCLNFGRNLILPTESVYHALMLGMWLAVLRGRWTTAMLLLLAMATTHPFTGAQSLAILGTWLTIQALRRKSRHSTGAPSARVLTSYIVIAALFVGYYFVFLPRFPQHREIQDTWTLGWVLSRSTILLAYGPAALLAWLGVRDDSAWRRRASFLLVAAGVSFLLANHQWFITPRQPIHFTRGYIWTPLWLAGLPVLLRCGEWLRGRRRLPGGFAILALAAIAVSDNVGFLYVQATSDPPPGFCFSDDERRAFDHLAKNQFRGVLLTDDDRIGYLAAAFTYCRPWIGHKYNTPGFEARLTQLAVFKSTSAAGELLDAVDLILTADPRVIRRVQDATWQRVATFGALQLWAAPSTAERHTND